MLFRLRAHVQTCSGQVSSSPVRYCDNDDRDQLIIMKSHADTLLPQRRRVRVLWKTSGDTSPLLLGYCAEILGYRLKSISHLTHSPALHHKSARYDQLNLNNLRNKLLPRVSKVMSQISTTERYSRHHYALHCVKSHSLHVTVGGRESGLGAPNP